MPRPSRFQSKSKGVQYLWDRFISDDPERIAALERARANAEAAQLIYDLRTEAGLSQAELAKRIGTARSVISRLEDSDYEGHTLSLLSRIAAALGRRVEIRFPPAEPSGIGTAPAASKQPRKPKSAKASSKGK